MKFHPIAEGVWEHSHLIRFWGASLPHRMTVVRLPDQTLLVHSPTRCDAATRQRLNDLGHVAHIVAPNGMHDLFLEDYAAAFPDARLWIPPGLDKYFSHLPRAERLPEEGDGNEIWRGGLSYVLVQGVPRLNECVFFHRPSRSLIVADLFFNIGKDCPTLIKIAARLGGFYQNLAIPLDIRRILIRDKRAFSESMQKLLSFDFDNIIIGHGTNAIGGGAEAFKAATAWLG